MKRFSILKLSVATVALALAFGMTATSATAKDINLCHLDGVSPQVIAKIRERADFGDLLQQVNKVCPASAVTLTAGATATVAGGPAGGEGGDGHGMTDKGYSAPQAASDDTGGTSDQSATTPSDDEPPAADDDTGDDHEKPGKPGKDKPGKDKGKHHEKSKQKDKHHAKQNAKQNGNGKGGESGHLQGLMERS